MMTFEEFQKQASLDLTVEPDTAEQKTLKISSIYLKYLDIYYSEMRKLKEIQQTKDKVYAELFHEFRKKGFEGYEIKDKNVEVYLSLNENYQKIVGEFKDQTHKVSYIENLLEQINKMSYNIKNFVDIMKLKAGMI
jgi:flagellar biosynthesis/type III secretory pathway protein FliH